MERNRTEEGEWGVILDFFEPRSLVRIKKSGSNVYRVDQNNMIVEILKINHSEHLDQISAMNATPETHIPDPILVRHLHKIANDTRRTGLPSQMISFIQTSISPMQHLLFLLKIEKLNKTDLLLFTDPITS